MRPGPGRRRDYHDDPDLPRLPGLLHHPPGPAGIAAGQPAAPGGGHQGAVGRAGRAAVPRRRHLAAARPRRVLRRPADPRPAIHHAGHLRLPRPARRGRGGPGRGLGRGAHPGTHRPADHRPGRTLHGARQPGGGRWALAALPGPAADQAAQTAASALLQIWPSHQSQPWAGTGLRSCAAQLQDTAAGGCGRPTPATPCCCTPGTTWTPPG